MHLTPHEKDKLLIAMAAQVARRRLERISKDIEARRKALAKPAKKG